MPWGRRRPSGVSGPPPGYALGMRIVVTGATGNVGTSVVEALARDPEVTSVLGLARREPRWTAPKTEWAAADIVTADLVPLMRDADVVIHLAWAFQPTHDSAATWRTNVIGGIRVFDAVAEAKVPALVYASSVGAYSPGPKDRAVDEGWPTHGWPGASYTREKAYLERVLDAFEARHPERRVVRLRPGFIFKRESAQEQRRIFGGPLVPNLSAGLLPVIPDIPALRFQALHTVDAAEAYRLAALGDAHGAFNLAAEPVIGSAELAGLLGARTIRVPPALVRGGLWAAWHLNLVPASPGLFDAVLRLPIMDTGKARQELGWSPRHGSTDALGEFFAGLKEGAGMPTPPLEARSPGRFRELLTGRR